MVRYGPLLEHARGIATAPAVKVSGHPGILKKGGTYIDTWKQRGRPKSRSYRRSRPPSAAAHNGSPPATSPPHASASTATRSAGSRRHSLATQLREAGYDANAIARVLGHSDPSFTQRTHIHKASIVRFDELYNHKLGDRSDRAAPANRPDAQ